MLPVAKVAGFFVVREGGNSLEHLRLFSAAPVKDTSDNNLKNAAFQLKATVFFLSSFQTLKGHLERQYIRVCVCKTERASYDSALLTGWRRWGAATLRGPQNWFKTRPPNMSNFGQSHRLIVSPGGQGGPSPTTLVPLRVL